LRAERHELPDDLIRDISPQIWEHINLTGIYDWMREPQPKGTFTAAPHGQEKFHRDRLIRRTTCFCHVLQCHTATHSSCRHPTLGSSALSRCFIDVRSWRCYTQRTPAGDIDKPRRFSISDTRS
jgi:hypothetical protein